MLFAAVSGFGRIRGGEQPLLALGNGGLSGRRAWPETGEHPCQLQVLRAYGGELFASVAISGLAIAVETGMSRAISLKSYRPQSQHVDLALASPETASGAGIAGTGGEVLHGGHYASPSSAASAIIRRAYWRLSAGSAGSFASSRQNLRFFERWSCAVCRLSRICSACHSA